VSSNIAAMQGPGDPAARPVRRSFTAEYRARVVAEYEASPHGQKAAVLRREGLYQSQIWEWTIARDALARGASTPRRPHRATGSGGGKDDPAAPLHGRGDGVVLGDDALEAEGVLEHLTEGHQTVDDDPCAGLEDHEAKDCLERSLDNIRGGFAQGDESEESDEPN